MLLPTAELLICKKSRMIICQQEKARVKTPVVSCRKKTDFRIDDIHHRKGNHLERP